VPSSVAHEQVSVEKLPGVIHSEVVSTGALHEQVLDQAAGLDQSGSSFSPPALLGTLPTEARGMNFLETVSVVDDGTLSAATDLFGRQILSGSIPAPPGHYLYTPSLSPIQESFLANPFMDSPNVIRILGSLGTSCPVKEESPSPICFLPLPLVLLC
jgi:hypothetical protein